MTASFQILYSTLYIPRPLAWATGFPFAFAGFGGLLIPEGQKYSTVRYSAVP
jgi:hypothetical protein